MRGATALAATVAEMEDVQGRADTRRIAIDRVGIKNIRYPISIEGRDGRQSSVAAFGMYVHLPHTVKGTHMSRFIEILQRQDADLSLDSFGRLLEHTVQYLNATTGYIEMAFPYFVKKAAPITGAASLMDYAAMLCGEQRAGKADVWLKVTVPVTSLCPCSKEIAAYGAHNQRAHITIAAKAGGRLWFEELIDLAEAQASCPLYGVLKRADEKYVTERAYDNAKFVEDVVRDIAVELNGNARVRAYVVEAENFESIHNHSAYALIECDKERH